MATIYKEKYMSTQVKSGTSRHRIEIYKDIEDGKWVVRVKKFVSGRKGAVGFVAAELFRGGRKQLALKTYHWEANDVLHHHTTQF